jgi:hypothetical protein
LNCATSSPLGESSKIQPSACQWQLRETFGRRKAFIGAALFGFVVFGFAGYLRLAGVRDIDHIRLLALLLIFAGNAGYAPVLIFLNERFPTAIRATGTAVCWNVGFATGGRIWTFNRSSQECVIDHYP